MFVADLLVAQLYNYKDANPHAAFAVEAAELAQASSPRSASSINAASVTPLSGIRA